MFKVAGQAGQNQRDEICYITREFWHAANFQHPIISSLLPTNSDERILPLIQINSEFLGRGGVNFLASRVQAYKRLEADPNPTVGQSTCCDNNPLAFRPTTLRRPCRFG